MSRALLLLASLPLLLPPGFCICRAESAGSRPTSGAVTARKRAPRCPCCKPPQTPRSRGLDSAPPTGPHLPNCPAHPSWEVARAPYHAAPELRHAALLAEGPALVDPVTPACLPHLLPPPDPSPPPSPHPVLRC